MSKTAFLFPGQGSQSLGMLSDIASNHELIGQTFAEASNVLGYDLWQLISDGPQEQLDQTEYTQPAMLVADIALWRLWCELGGRKPDYVAGHSLGEYAALVAANALSLPEAVGLVQKRGQYMQEAVPAGIGGMLVIVGLNASQITEICQTVSSEEHVLQAANLNAPTQIVLAGHRACFDKAITLAETMGASLAKPLAMSVPAHSPLLKDAASKYGQELKRVNWQTPKIPVIHNTDVQSHTGADAIQSILQQQLYSPVRWVESIEYLVANGVERFVECGPGRVLVGLMRRISRRSQAISINTDEQLREGLSHD